ncbi:MAG TPA: NAD(P)/FAD-dependent oxidoreductase [Candidatus Nanoarchaeia archaeon]|nr:NAD(P)/FAD-dependent oxidoreductase [Candidatus Nanoarchaeia archaeon]
MNIAVIGAGPIGCYAAYLLAKDGHLVEIYENHPRIGMPIQCTGILTSDFDEFGFPMDSFLVNTINKIEVNSPHNQLEVKQNDYIVCRNKFDNFFGDMAKNIGVKIFLNHSFVRKEGGELIVKDSAAKIEKRIRPDIVIAADGPLSPTAKAYNMYHPERENYFGVQATVEGNFDPNTIKTYFGNEVCPGLFAWVTPENSKIARVGLAAMKDSRKYFDKFMKENGFTVKEMQAGTIPVYNPNQKLHQDNCYLVGDASGYVKATTLGGLVPALKQVEILVYCIKNGKDYDQEISPVKRKMWVHLQVQKIFNKFSDQDWDKLVSYVKQAKVQRVFEKHTRDNPIPLVSLSLLYEPRFLYFLKHFF